MPNGMTRVASQVNNRFYFSQLLSSGLIPVAVPGRAEHDVKQFSSSRLRIW
jgi:hypothetical protein